MRFSASGQVDSRIVELKFENQQFEQNAKTSLSTLERLKSALDFSKSKQTFTDIGNGLKSISIGPLNNGVQTLTASFSALDVMATRALMNITDSIQNAATGFLSSVTIDQVSAGWDKYAEKTSAVQTIMAATAKDWEDTGAQMEYVNAQLDKLNWFTDETSFNFLDMVNNIGKFTSNNIDLDQSVTAMEGISNWAAISGANINEAGRAMYNLSQAIAVGSVKLMDWKSIENANMATAEFKQTAIETAAGLGLLTDVGNGLYETLEGNEVSVSNFNSALKDEWFSSEVLLKTLERYGEFTDKLNEFYEAAEENVTTSDLIEYVEAFKEGELDLDEAVKETGLSVNELKGYLNELSSEEMAFGLKAFKAAQEAKTFEEAVDSVKDAVSTGWMNTFEIMFGDYLQAKEVWTGLANNLYDIFAEGGNARNELLKEAFDEEATINKNDWDRLTESGLASPLFISKLRDASKAHNDYAKSMIDNETWLRTALDLNLITISDFETAWDGVFGAGANADDGLRTAVEDLMAANEEVNSLVQTFDKWSAEDVGGIIFGNHIYDGETRELEEDLDSILEKLNLGQEAGDGLVLVLKDMGYFGGVATDHWKGMSEEELRTLGLTDEMIAAYKDAIENGKSAEEVKNAILTANMSTKDMWFAALKDGMDAIVGVFEVAKEAWDGVFPPATVDTIRSIVMEVYDAVEAFSDFVETSDTLRKAFEALFSILDIAWTVVRGLASGAIDILRALIEGLGIDIGGIINYVSDLIIKARAWIKTSNIVGKTMRLITTIVGLAAKQVRKWFDAFKSIPAVNSAITAFKAGIKSALTNLPSFIDGLTNAFTEFGHKVGALDGIKLDNISDVFEAFKETVLNYLMNFPGFRKVADAFGKLKTEVKDKLSGIGINVDGLRAKFNSLINIDYISKTVDRFKKAFATLPKQIGPFINGLKEKWEEFNKTVANAGGFKLDNIKEIFKAFKDTILGYFLNFEGFDPIKQAFSGLGSDIKSKLSDMGIDVDKIKEKISNFIEDIKKVVGSFEIPKSLSDLFNIFKKHEEDNKGTEKSGSILSKAISKITEAAKSANEKANAFPKWLKDTASGILALVMAISAVKILGFVSSISKVIKSIANLNNAKANAINKAGILMLAGAIAILAASLLLISKIPSEKLLGTVVAIGAIAAMLFALSAASSKFVSNSDMLAIGGGMALMAAGILEIALAMKVLETVKIENLPKVIGMLIGIMLSLVVFGGIAAKLGSFSGGLGILAIVTSLYLMLGVLKILDKFTLEHPLAVVGKLIMLIGLMAVLFLSTRALGEGANSSALAIVAMSASLILMAGALLAVSLIKKEKLWGAVGAIAVLSVCLGLLMVAAGKLGTSSMGSILMLGTVLAALAVSLVALTFVNQEKLKNATACISIILLVLTLFSGITGLTSTSWSSFASILAMIGVVSAIAVILGILSNITDPDKALKTAQSLSMVILALTGMMLGLALAGLGAAGIAAVLPLLGIIIGVFGALSIILGLIDQYADGNLADAIDRGVEIMVKIGDGLGRFFGAIVKGFAVEAMSGLPEVADYLVQFMEKMQGLNGLESINWAILLDALGAITAVSFTEFLTALPNIVTEIATGKSAVEQFGDDLVSLSTGLTTWADAVNGMGEIEVDSAGISSLCAQILKVSAVEIGDAISSALVSLALGDGDKISAVEQFSDDLGRLADGLKSWESKMNDLGSITVPSESISNLASEISKINWLELKGAFESILPELLTGESGVEKFKNDTERLADALLDWQAKMDKLSSIAIPQDAIDNLVAAINSVPESGIIDAIEDFFGGNDIDAFAGNLESLGTALATFSEKLGDGFKADDVRAATEAIAIISSCGDQIKDLAPDAFASFGGLTADLVAGITPLSGMTISGDLADNGAKVDSFVDNIKKLVDLINSELANLDTSSVDTFKNAVETLSNTDISALTEKMASKTDGSEIKAMQDAGKNMGTSLAESVGSQSGAMESAMGTLTSAATKVLSDAQGSFGSSALELVRAMSAAVSGASDFGAALNYMVSSALSSIDVSGAYNSGLYFAQGFANGISANAFAAQAQAVAMARAALAAANAAIGAHSPARELIKTGRYFSQGFAIGIDQLAGMAVYSATSMAEDAASGMRSAISSIKDILCADLDGEPTIRPVLDLSEIEAGAGSIGGLLSNVRPISLMSDLDIIQTNSRAMRNRASTDDLIAAISGLDIGGTTNNYNVDGITYDDGTNIAAAVRTLVHAVRAGGRA